MKSFLKHCVSWLLSCILGVFGGYIYAHWHSAHDRGTTTVRAARFELVDSSGKVLAFWGSDRGNNTVLAFLQTSEGAGPGEYSGATPQTRFTGQNPNEAFAVGMMSTQVPFMNILGKDGSSVVNKCSLSHKLGTATGIALSIVIGGAAGAEAAEANAGREGYEFSHFIPDRIGGPRSVFNGNYVSQELHYLTDNFRYPSGWQNWGPKLPPVAQQILRIPWVYPGAAAGAAYGGAAAARGGCGCN